MTTSQRNSKPRPVLQAFLLADQVYRDHFSGKWIIAGTFNSLLARELPSMFGRDTFAYVNLTALRGSVTLRLKFVDMEDMSVLLEGPEILVKSSDPNATLETAFPVPPLPMKHEGVFSFELHADDVLVGSLRVNVAKLENKR